MLEQTQVAAVRVEYKSEGMDAEAVAFHITGQSPKQPVILLSAYSDLPERVLWSVDALRDEKRTTGTGGAACATSGEPASAKASG